MIETMQAEMIRLRENAERQANYAKNPESAIGPEAKDYRTFFSDESSCKGRIIKMVNTGSISQIIGPVLDLQFEEGKTPAIYNAIEIRMEDGGRSTEKRTPTPNPRPPSS
jgi:hypothetical protein